jgi:chromosome segregation ATPase
MTQQVSRIVSLRVYTHIKQHFYEYCCWGDLRQDLLAKYYNNKEARDGTFEIFLLGPQDKQSLKELLHNVKTIYEDFTYDRSLFQELYSLDHLSSLSLKEISDEMVRIKKHNDEAKKALTKRSIEAELYKKEIEEYKEQIEKDKEQIEKDKEQIEKDKVQIEEHKREIEEHKREIESFIDKVKDYELMKASLKYLLEQYVM